MPNKKISELPLITSMSLTDVIPVVSGGSTSQISLSDLKMSMGGGTLTVSGFTPTSGKVGDTILISGTNFTYATSVLFGGVTASFSILGDTLIQATLSSLGASGYVTVVTNANSALYPGFTYVYGPIVSGFVPTSAGPEELVTISGSNFTGPTATAVLVGGASQSFTVVNANTIRTILGYNTISGTVSVIGPNGVGKLGGFTYNTPKKLSLVYTNDATIIVHEEDDLSTMMTWISSYTITGPVTLQFNTNDTFTMSSQLSFGFNNGGYTFSVMSINGNRPTLDVMNLDKTVVQSGMSNFYMGGFTFKNARPVSVPGGGDEGGTIIRVLGNTSNVTFDNLILDGGFCGVRGTTKITNLTLSNLTVLNVWAGCFRLGNGYWLTNGNYDFDQRPLDGYDMYNLVIRNITAVDNLNGGTVSGTQQPGNPSGNNYSGVLLLKMFHTIDMSHVTVSTGGDCLAIENCFNVNLSYINIYNMSKGGRGFLISKTDVLTIAQSYCSDITDGSSRYLAFIDYVRSLKMYNNTFFSLNPNCAFVYGANMMKVVEIAGNVFMGNVYCGLGFSLASTSTLISQEGAPSDGSFTYSATLANDWLSDHDNLYSSNGAFTNFIQLSNFAPGGLGGFSASGTTLNVRNAGSNTYTPATYLSNGYGVNNQWAYYPTNFTLSTRVNVDGSTSSSVYIPNGYYGRNAINSAIPGISYPLDLAGNTRTYPTDMGAYDRDAI